VTHSHKHRHVVLHKGGRTITDHEHVHNHTPFSPYADVLPEGDDFLVWANEEPAKVEPPKVKQADRDIKQVSRERSKVKQTASSRAAVRQTQSDNWSRPARRYRREPVPDFYAPRFFSRW